MGLFIRRVGIARAKAKTTLASLVYNIDRLIFQELTCSPEIMPLVG